ncbi:hypothetical protein DFH09DRAFT_1424873 [Mycena vulgaris]|nr:hypothetical protein DFH09DRAFT_1424873 [Mycena vulgaris]
MHRSLEIPEIIRTMFERLLDDSSGFPPLHIVPTIFEAFPVSAKSPRLKESAPLLKSHLGNHSGLWVARRNERFAIRSDRHAQYYAPGGLSLPNLQRLGWNPSDPALLSYVRLFLGPKLSSIVLTVRPTLPYLSLLAYLASGFPSLLTVRTSAEDLIPPAPYIALKTLEGITSFVLALNPLRSLSVSGLLPPAYHYLGRLASLESLAINQLADSPFPDDAIPHSYHYFPSLRRLTIHSPRVDFVPILNQYCVHILGYFAAISPSSLITSFSTALRDHSARSHLTDVNVRVFYSGGGREPAACRITPQVIQPLLSFPNLVVLCLETPAGYALNDNFCASMAAAWPRIALFELNTGFGHSISTPSTSDVTPAALSAFARHCPHLQDLTLAMDATRVPPTALHEQRLGDPEWEDGRCAKWEEVGRLALMFAAVRSKDETYWAAEFGRSREVVSGVGDMS